MCRGGGEGGRGKGGRARVPARHTPVARIDDKVHNLLRTKPGGQGEGEGAGLLGPGHQKRLPVVNQERKTVREGGLREPPRNQNTAMNGWMGGVDDWGVGGGVGAPVGR